MKLVVEARSATATKCDLLVVGVFKTSPNDADGATATKKKSKAAKAATTKKSAKKESTTAPREVHDLDEALGGVLWSTALADGFSGESGTTCTVHTHDRIPARRVVLVGLGAKDDVTEDGVRKLGGKAVRLTAKEKSVAIVSPDVATLSTAAIVEACVEGALLAGYRFDRYITDADKRGAPSSVTVLVAKADLKLATAAARRGEAVSAGVNLARDLVNECPRALTPVQFAKEASVVAQKSKLQIQVFDEKALAKEKMGLMLAVAQAALPYTPPRLVRLAYRPAGKAKKHIVLVGKGLTFDSGGLDIKPAAGMLDMKVDMSGAAAVLGAMAAIGALKPDVAVTAYLGCVENGIGGNAYHPGDVLTSRKGLTVEINNTDAEGRLVLADCIDYALTKDKPDVLIDLATLTGACMIALGPTTAGLFTPDDELAADIRNAGQRVGEDFWRLPLNDELNSMLASPIADMRNTGERYGGAITAALFLKKFVDGRARWAHLDIAGPATNEKDHPYTAKGGAGFGVRTLTALIAPRV